MKNKKQIGKNLIFNIISFALNFCISFLFTPYLIRVVGKEAYSFFPLVNNIIGYSTILTTAVGSMAGRFVIMSLYRNDIESANKYFNSVWVANILLSVFFTFVAIICTLNLQYLLTIPEYLESDVKLLFLIGALSLVFGLLTGVMGLGTYVKNRVDKEAAVKVIYNITRVLCIIALFYLFSPSIVYMSISAMVAGFVTIYFNLSFKKKLLPELTTSPIKYFDWKYLKETISSGIWNSVNQLSQVLSQQFDLLITNVLISASATGDYAIAKTAPMLILHLLAMLSGTFIPHYNILYAKGEMKELVSDVKKTMAFISIFINIPLGFLLVASKEFFDLWVPNQDSVTLYWLCFLTVFPMMFGASVNPIYGIFGVTNKLRIPSLILLVSSVIQTITTLILLKTTGFGIWIIPVVAGICMIIRNTIFVTIYGAHCLGQNRWEFFPQLLNGIIGVLVVSISCSFIMKFVIINSWKNLFFVFILTAIISSVINIFVITNKTTRLSVVKMIKNKLS